MKRLLTVLFNAKSVILRQMALKNQLFVTKKILTVFILVLIFPIFAGCDPLTLTPNCDLIRIHIVANSNSDFDQAQKYLVRDAIKAHLEEPLHQKTSIANARAFIQRELSSIREVAIQTMQNNGHIDNFSSAQKNPNNNAEFSILNSASNIQVQARFSREFFPTRAYSNLVVESGYFYALMIVLGSGQGNNWWCVIYPPLCYLAPIQNAGAFRYRSWILELFRR
ncbi:MAG: stage II sporulation protein R [Firmicutes bacterium]|nr:stage II sporulation protein R [Bacillota bacterium]